MLCGFEKGQGMLNPRSGKPLNGDIPACSVNRRLDVRKESRACSAMALVVRFRCRLCSIHAKGPGERDGIGRLAAVSDELACPPSRLSGMTADRAASAATADP